MSTMYRAYGLDPEKCNLRARVGVDVPSIPFVNKTMGTIQPDLLRVLEQDQFQPELLKMNAAYAREKLIVHLQGNQHALGLIKRKENGNLHWILLTSYTNSMLAVADSLAPEPYTEAMDPYLKSNLLSVVMVSPTTNQQSVFKGKLHRSGLSEMIKSWTRGK